LLHAAHSRGATYLTDGQLLFHDAMPAEWPQLVGRVDASSGAMLGMGADAASTFFRRLDTFLKEQQVGGQVGLRVLLPL